MMPVWPALLAQTYWKQSNPEDSRIFLIVLGALVAVALVYSLIKKLSSGTISSRVPGFRSGTFRRKALDVGFSDAEADFLEHYARKLGVQNPQSVFGTRQQLDSFIKATFRYIDRHAETEESAEDLKGRLFAIREALSLRINSGAAIRSSRQLKARTPISLVTNKEAHYASLIVFNEPRALYVEPALDAFGVPIRFTRGSKLTVFFYAGNHVGYNFHTRSGGLVNLDGRQLLALSHNDSVKQLPSRRHQRREARLSGRFYLVHVHAARDRGKVVKSVQVEKAAVPSIITDVSAGGLSMQTMSPANVGEFVKIEFDLGAGTRWAYASVVRASRLRSGTSLHLKFVKIPRKTVNEILSYVYGFE
ncbi:MAG: PilZ domain-containing protein [Spirochaetia bacterium]|nr:PilZ domain-containing protein [Spirochaetia bacterium]